MLRRGDDPDRERKQQERQARAEQAQATANQIFAAAAEAKATAQQAKEAAQRRKRDDAARAAHLATPEGQAQTAFARGAGFFQIELAVSEVSRTMTGGSRQGYDVRQVQRPSHADVLSQIEGAGWHLEHVGYAYVMTGQISRDKLLTSGQETGVMGQLKGIYLFRRNEPPKSQNRTSLTQR